MYPGSRPHPRPHPQSIQYCSSYVYPLTRSRSQRTDACVHFAACLGIEWERGRAASTASARRKWRHDEGDSTGNLTVWADVTSLSEKPWWCFPSETIPLPDIQPSMHSSNRRAPPAKPQFSQINQENAFSKPTKCREELTNTPVLRLSSSSRWWGNNRVCAIQNCKLILTRSRWRTHGSR